MTNPTAQKNCFEKNGDLCGLNYGGEKGGIYGGEEGVYFRRGSHLWVMHPWEKGSCLPCKGHLDKPCDGIMSWSTEATQQEGNNTQGSHSAFQGLRTRQQ